MEYNFHHIHLRCQDLEATVAYYEKVFNGTVTERVNENPPVEALQKVTQNIFL